jgi:hypothetical protein
MDGVPDGVRSVVQDAARKNTRVVSGRIFRGKAKSPVLSGMDAPLLFLGVIIWVGLKMADNQSVIC